MDSENGMEINEIFEANKKAIDVYKDLRKISAQTAGFSADTTLSFIVEESRNCNGDAWEKDVANLKQKLMDVNTTEGKVGSLWVLTERAATDYINFLSKMMESPDAEPKEKENAGIIIEIITDMLLGNKELYDEKEECSPVIIPPDYAPEWRKLA